MTVDNKGSQPAGPWPLTSEASGRSFQHTHTCTVLSARHCSKPEAELGPFLSGASSSIWSGAQGAFPPPDMPFPGEGEPGWHVLNKLPLAQVHLMCAQKAPTVRRTWTRASRSPGVSPTRCCRCRAELGVRAPLPGHLGVGRPPADTATGRFQHSHLAGKLKGGYSLTSPARKGKSFITGISDPRETHFVSMTLACIVSLGHASPGGGQLLEVK